MNMPSPKNKEKLQRFLGMLTYLNKFIPNLFHIAAPLQNLLEKDVEWYWQDDQIKSFVALKQLVTEAPVLILYDQPRSLWMPAPKVWAQCYYRTTIP